MISFFHYTILARLDAFVNAVEYPNQNNRIKKKNLQNLERKLLLQTLVQIYVTVRQWIMDNVYAPNRHLESPTAK